MNKIDPIIAVHDIETSSAWYKSLFGWHSLYEPGHFEILVSEENEIQLCLHRWGEDHHPTMMDPAITPGHGLILYIKTDRLENIREKADRMKITVEEDMHLNTNSLRNEFSLRDPDGYCLTITEYHEYEG